MSVIKSFYTISTIGILLLLAAQVHFEEKRTGRILLMLIFLVFLLMFVFSMVVDF